MRRWQRLEAELNLFRQTRLACVEGFSPQVRLILWHIHNNPFDATLSVRELKLRCRITDNNISSRFKHEMEQSIRQYVEALRLDGALMLFQRTDFSIGDIAQAVGYRHPQTFYRAFTRRLRCRPGALRGAIVRKKEVGA